MFVITKTDSEENTIRKPTTPYHSNIRIYIVMIKFTLHIAIRTPITK